MNSFGLMTILEMSPSPNLLMISRISCCVVSPRALGIQSAGYSYSVAVAVAVAVVCVMFDIDWVCMNVVL